MSRSGDSARILRRFRRRLVGMSGSDVARVVEVIRARGSVCVIAGGWGVDALVGRKTRRHADLDLAVDDGSDTPGEAAAAALESMGFALLRCDVVDGARLGRRQLYEDRVGRLVDLHPAHVGAGQHRRPRPGIPVLGEGSVVLGTVGHRSVPCLSIREQVASHGGYCLRDADHRDLAALAALRIRLQAADQRSGASVAPYPSGREAMTCHLPALWSKTSTD